MDDQTARRLLALNHTFYNTFADSFSDSRARTEPGFQHILARITPGARVLDLGCGQGRLALLLPADCTYVGVDYAGAMLRVAKEAVQARSDIDASFIIAGLVDDNWPAEIDQRFDWVVIRAVLHHIPGYSHRLAIVRSAGQVLASEGRLAIANWQFTRVPRLMRRALPWSEAGLEAKDVESGDYLLDWQRDGHGVRYVHLVDEAETQQIAQDAALQVDELFYADGHSGDLTLYALLRT